MKKVDHGNYYCGQKDLKDFDIKVYVFIQTVGKKLRIQLKHCLLSFSFVGLNGRQTPSPLCYQAPHFVCMKNGGINIFLCQVVPLFSDPPLQLLLISWVFFCHTSFQGVPNQFYGVQITRIRWSVKVFDLVFFKPFLCKNCSVWRRLSCWSLQPSETLTLQRAIGTS